MTSAEAVRLAAALTSLRLVAAPVIAMLLLLGGGEGEAALSARLIALGVFIVAALSDLADGWIARRFNAVTPLGAALDHAADKVLTTATLFGLAMTIWPPYLAAAAIGLLLRDFLVAGLREGLALSGRALPVDATGKWKTGLLMTGLSAALLEAVLRAWPPSGIADAAWLLSHIGILGALVLALISAALYVRRALRPNAA